MAPWNVVRGHSFIFIARELMQKQILIIMDDDGHIGYNHNTRSKTEFLGLLDVVRFLYMLESLNVQRNLIEKPNGLSLTPPGAEEKV